MFLHGNIVKSRAKRLGFRNANITPANMLKYDAIHLVQDEVRGMQMMPSIQRSLSGAE